MQYSEAKRNAARILADAGIEEAEVDAEYLLFKASGLKRSTLFVKLFEEMPKIEEETYRELIDRRSTHEPLQYILGSQNFMGYDFKVTPDVLIPRFDTEILAELAVKRLLELKDEKQAVSLLDLCTGSGCVAVSVGLKAAPEFEKISVFGTDISEAAVKVARNNYEANVTEEDLKSLQERFFVSDLFENIEGCFDMITANPPYIVRDEIRDLMPEITEHEPYLALDGGNDGMDFYRRICEAAPGYLKRGGRLLMEFDDSQAEPVRYMMEKAGFVDIEVHRDLAGLRRVIEGVSNNVRENRGA